jgi:hypothetical protein
MEERKRRDFYVRGSSHTRVFSIGRERPRVTLPRENPHLWVQYKIAAAIMTLLLKIWW